MHLSKAREDIDVHDRQMALQAIHAATKREEVLTGLLYVDTNPCDLHDILNTATVPLNSLNENTLCPGNSTLQTINQSFR